MRMRLPPAARNRDSMAHEPGRKHPSDPPGKNTKKNKKNTKKNTKKSKKKLDFGNNVWYNIVTVG